MSTRAWTAVLLALVAGVGLAASGIVTMPSVGNFSIGDQTSDETQQDGVSVIDASTDGQLTFPTSASNMDVYLADVEATDLSSETTSPVHYGDYVDFSASDAISGLTEGVEYHKVSLSSSKTATFADLEPGTYDLIVVDKAGTREYHYHFGQVTMPERISEFKAENNNVVELTRNTDGDKVVFFDRWASYKDDSSAVYQPGQTKAVALDANIDDPSSNVTDRQRTIERSVTHTSGVSYLGKFVVKNFNPDDGVSKLAVSVSCEGSELYSKTLLDGATDEIGSDNAFSESLVSEAQHNPKECNGEVLTSVDVTYDASTLSGSADDDEIGTGEKIADFEVQDIYGNSLGSDGLVSITG
ncbi:hypothetical protein [Halorarum salinum]|uniref:Uncharacterized protein n=1 Tax=Halorarum salinum TaxID=2743089 RepID=A0A7D5QB50_9EURY|nr:hypothetical protein [Halobaculum salinum]QLG61979.1 hypothetical protein HUG12_09700 [Halobaculum salinum]